MVIGWSSRIVPATLTPPLSDTADVAGVNFGVSGSMAALFPRRIPPSTHRVMSSICSCDRLRSLRNCPKPLTAPHGGIVRASTTFLIAMPRGWTSWNVIKEKAVPSGRWHDAHLS